MENILFKIPSFCFFRKRMLRILAFFAVFLAAKGNVIPNFTPFLLSNAMVCREDFIVQKYSLAKSNSCNNRQRTLVHTCSSQIYDPQFIVHLHNQNPHYNNTQVLLGGGIFTEIRFFFCPVNPKGMFSDGTT